MEVDSKPVASGSVASSTSLKDLLPSPDNQARRADLLALKLRLAALLPPADGERYWAALVDFMTGKINRSELGKVMNRVLGTSGEAVRLHNALLLSILYNTTRPALPPSAVRYSGWHKRKRDKDGQKIEDRDPKRRRVKEAVMALGKRERAELKMLGLRPKKESELERDKERDKATARLYSLGASLDSRGPQMGPDGLPLALADAKQPPATLPQDYLRCSQTPLCYETRMLPDVDSLKDRMSLLAYDSGLVAGADSKVALLGVQALEMYLKSMVSSAITLVRTKRSLDSGKDTPVRAQLSQLASNADTSSTTAPIGSDTPTQSSVDEKIARTADLIAGAISPAHKEPLSAHDFSSLFEISPGLLVQAHMAAVERLYACPPLSESEYSGDESDTEDEPPVEDGGDSAMQEVSQQPPTGKYPKLSRSSSLNRPGRPGSRSNSISRVPAAAGRQQFLIDPSAVAIPTGHPDVAHPRSNSLSQPPPITTASESSSTRANGAAAAATTTNGGQTPQQLSPKSLALRHQLFPELEETNPQVASLQHPMSPHNNTSTDGGSDSDEASHVHDQATKGAREREQGRDGRGGSGARQDGRKLWEVVDSVRLLDGVL